MRDVEEEVPVAYLFEIFSADFEKGELRWKVRPLTDDWRATKIWNIKNAGNLVGNLTPQGALQVKFRYNHRQYYSTVHRVLWTLKHGKWPGRSYHIDHKNHFRTDNRIEELRLATPLQNMRNKRKYKQNTSGFKGAYYIKRDRIWAGKIGVKGKLIHLGTFKSAREAALAYDKAATQIFGDFAKTNASLGLFEINPVDMFADVL
jgi:hypothetical protein